MPIPLRLAADVPGRERLVRERLEREPETRAQVFRVLEEAFVDGVIELARLEPGMRGPHLSAVAAVPADGAVDADALARWHRHLGGSGEWRRSALEAASPPEFVADRVGRLHEWLVTDSGRELQPSAAGALVLARLMEIQPFEDWNTSVALMAARQAMRRGGGLGMVLREEDRASLRNAVPQAQAFETRPLAVVLEKGALRALELAVAELERRG